jgi:N-acetyl-1-D-myo-inositol-2-amino-2-deoxy-alpha-D-glucopyranoside deacetylase
MMSNEERVLFVHAHPDDESITTGGTLATLVDRGAHVTVLTCTRGERGEVIPADLQHLIAPAAVAELGLPSELAQSEAPPASSALAAHRETELASAMRILGVTDQRYLGDTGARWVGREPRRYLDSGMVWGSDGAQAVERLDPNSLAAADFGEVASDVAAVITDVRPDVVVSYNDFGGYGHPDHIRAAQAARRAAEVYNVPFYAVEPAGSVALATLAVDVEPVLDRKRAALAAHRTQVAVTGDSFALSNGVSQKIDTVELFRRVPRDWTSGRTPFNDQTLSTKIISAIVALALGLVVGALLTVAHLATVTIADLAVPLGLIAGVLIVAALLAGLRLALESRMLVGATAVGLIAAIGVLSVRSTGGSTLVPQTSSGYVWAIAPTLIAVVVLAWPHVPSRRRGKIVSRPEVKGSLLK